MKSLRQPPAPRRSSRFGQRRPAHALDPNQLVVRGAHQHNLRHIDVTIPRNKLVVLTGLSGSGKSSLAFDTIFAEGQRRYVESLSTFARQYVEQMEKPKVEFIAGLSPTIAIEQRTVSRNPRSTVGTITEIINYLRLLYSRIGTPHCLSCGHAIEPTSAQSITERLLALPPGTTLRICGGRDESATLTLPQERAAFRGELLGVIKRALKAGDGTLTTEANGQERHWSEKSDCPRCGRPFPPLMGAHFNPNTPMGMCGSCNGMGTELTVDPELIIADPKLSILDGALRWYGNFRKKKGATLETAALPSIAEHYGVDLETPWKDLPQRFRDALIYGSGDEKIKIDISGVWENTGSSYALNRNEPINGIVAEINRLFRSTKSESARRKYSTYMSQKPCHECGGERISAEARSVTLGGRRITEVSGMSIDDCLAWLESLSDTLTTEQMAIGAEAMEEIGNRLQFMVNVGLHYLTLDRSAPTLSGGEAQRIRLASQIGSALVGVLYVLDEPSIGLHPIDNQALLDTLLYLRDIGNTVLVVEHDMEIIRSADWLIDIGPGAGVLGGEVIAAGTPEQVAANPRSITGKYLSGEARVHAPRTERRRPGARWLTVEGARLHNLKNITARFPIGLLSCVTGVSGGGKSSLISGTLYPALQRQLHGSTDLAIGPHSRLDGVHYLDKVITITQEPIGRTPRSNPATYIGLFDGIRQLFAETPEARRRDYKADRFSFNVPGGRCESCQGHGQKRVEMHFLPDVWINCSDCDGTRFNEETREIRYRGKNINDVLEMDVQEALRFFADQPKLLRQLQTLHDVGLDYIKLGQSATTLSGGEAQRIKLASELSRVATGRTIYILDEPTTGLHFADVQRLLDVLHRLVDAGNTMIVIEHNLDVIKTADWIVDIGPEGGESGGTLVAEGTPEQVAEVEASYTGQFLREALAELA
jgi:excinuclease ABC subunit A